VSDNRRARRFVVNVPAVCESIGQPVVKLHPNLARVYQRVEASGAKVGQRFPAVVRDLSTNGAFVTGEALPLLTRVAIHFELKNIGSVDAIGWVLWRRDADCEIPGPDGTMVLLPRGFGILFEAIPLETRQAIALLAR
jgi:hypothetical protein